MAIFNIDKINVDAQGRIHIYEGKVSYIFGDIGQMEERANRSNTKTQDLGIQAVCKHLVDTPALRNDLPAVANIPVIY